MKTLQQKIEKLKAKIAKAETELAKMPQPRTHKWMKGDLIFVEPTGRDPEANFFVRTISPRFGIVRCNDTQNPDVIYDMHENAFVFHDSSLTLISDQEFAGEDWL